MGQRGAVGLWPWGDVGVATARAAAGTGIASLGLQEGARPAQGTSRAAGPGCTGEKVGKPSPGAKAGSCGAGGAAWCGAGAARWRPARAWLLGGGARDGAAQKLSLPVAPAGSGRGGGAAVSGGVRGLWVRGGALAISCFISASMYFL